MKIKKKNTKELLIDSSIELFSRKWYETLSVAEICRNANLSNGVFYRYFKNKKELFDNVLNLFIHNFDNELCKISGNTFERRLESFYEIIINSGQKYKDLIIIYREGQYRFPEFEKKLRILYINSLNKVFDRKINELEYIYTISGIRFLNLRSLFTSISLNADDPLYITKNGYFDLSIRNYNDIFKKEIVFSNGNLKNNSKDKLIKSGIKLFGIKGFFNVNIYDITSEAGFAVGTFYQYFKSKNEFMSEIVNIIGKETRHVLSINLSKEFNRLENEIRGIYVFLKYFEKYPYYYEIVREAEFIVNYDVKKYYDSFENGYIKNLNNIKIQNKKIVANMLMGLSHYLGIEYLFQKNISSIENFLSKLGDLLSRGIYY